MNSSLLSSVSFGALRSNRLTWTGHSSTITCSLGRNCFNSNRFSSDSSMSSRITRMDWAQPLVRTRLTISIFFTFAVKSAFLIFAIPPDLRFVFFRRGFNVQRCKADASPTVQYRQPVVRCRLSDAGPDPSGHVCRRISRRCQPEDIPALQSGCNRLSFVRLKPHLQLLAYQDFCSLCLGGAAFGQKAHQLAVVL
jgi:hypothetical protein